MARRLLSGASQKLHAAAGGLALRGAARRGEGVVTSALGDGARGPVGGVVDWSLPSSSGARLGSARTRCRRAISLLKRGGAFQIRARVHGGGDGQAEPGRARAAVDVGGDVEEDAEGGGSPT